MKALKRIIAIIAIIAMTFTSAVGMQGYAKADTLANNDSSITVYLTISDNGRFVGGNDSDRTMMCRVPITIDYFDLADYGLEKYYRYTSAAPEDGGAYNGSEVLQQPTVLHLLIKALEQYYIEEDKLQLDTDALTVSGGATSLFMEKFWGHDQNFMYFINDQYPVMKAGWGATADYILLEDGMDIDIAMFSDWDFYNNGAFASLSPDEVTVDAGEEFTLTMNGTSTGVNGNNNIKSMSGENIVYTDAEVAVGEYDNDAWEALPYKTDENGQITMSFDQPGTYYVSSTSDYESYKSDSGEPCVAPPIAVVRVTGDIPTEDVSGTENISVLSSLKFTEGTSSSSYEYHMTPSFDSAKAKYTVDIPDNCKNVALWSVRSNEAASVKAATKVTVSYIDTAGNSKEITSQLGSNSGINLPGLIKSGAIGSSVHVTASCGKSSQSYDIDIQRIPALKALNVTDSVSNDVALSPDFDSQQNDYVLSVPASEKYLNVNMEAVTGSSIVSVNGQTVDSSPVRVAMTDSNSQEVIIDLKGENGGISQYNITVNKRSNFICSFTDVTQGAVCTLKDNEGNIIFSRKASSEGMSLLAENIMEGNTYTYSITAAGYKGKRNTVIADSDIVIDGQLSIADINDKIDNSMTSLWPGFRSDINNNGITSALTPINASNAELMWSLKNGSDWTGSPSSPILVGDNIVFTAGSQIIKLDRVSGEILKTGNMVSKSAFSLVPPTYANGMIFVPLAGGRVQAFDANTLESLWIYTDSLGGQPNSPITYNNGYVYVGFWNNDTKDANMVCLSVTDEDTENTEEDKLDSWSYKHKGGFYWAGVCAANNRIICGSDNGEVDTDVQQSTLYSFDPLTGEVLDTIDTIKGDIRSTVVYDEDSGKYCFTSRGGYFYTVELSENGTFDKSSLKEIELNIMSGSGTSASATRGQSSSTPVVCNGRAYVGVSGSSVLGAYSGHNITVIDLNSSSVAYQVETRGYAQASPVLTTGYNANTGYNYIYYIENYTPGIMRVIKDKKGQMQASRISNDNCGILGEDLKYADTLFTPRGEQAEYGIGSPIIDEYGTIYYKNDSSSIMAIGNKVKAIEVTNMPTKTEYEAGDIFDPSGMVVTATLANGMTRDVTDYVTYFDEPLTEQDLEIEITFPYVMYNDKEKKADPPAAYISITSISNEELAAVKETSRIIDELQKYNGLGVTDEMELAVENARLSYDELGFSLQKYIKNKDVLVDAEMQIADNKLALGSSSGIKCNVSASAYNGIKVTWNSNSNANGYEIYRSTVEGELGTKIKTVTDRLTLSITNSVTTGIRYYYTIRPYIIVDGNAYGTLYSSQKSAVATLDKSKAKVSSVSYNSLKVTWNKISGAYGYKIYRASSKSGSYKLIKTITSGSTLSYTNSSLTTGSYYYYKVKAYRGSAYGSYSDIVYASPKLAVPSSLTVKSGSKKSYISWKKVAGASGYTVARATSYGGSYRTIKTIKSYKTLKYTNTSLKKGRIYYYKVRAYKSIKGRKVYGSYTKVVKIKIK